MIRVLLIGLVLGLSHSTHADTFKLKINHYIETQKCGHHGDSLGEEELLMLGAQLFFNETEIKDPKRVVNWAFDTQITKWEEPRSLALPLQFFSGAKAGQEWTIKAIDKISGATDLLKLKIVKESSSLCGGSL